MKLSPLVTYAAARPRRAAYFAVAYLAGCAVWLYYTRYHRPKI